MQPWFQTRDPGLQGHRHPHLHAAITLDGAFTLQLDGPSRTNYDLVVKSGGKVVDRTTRRGSRDRIHYRIACRDAARRTSRSPSCAARATRRRTP
jgi:hypothetical protein